MNEPQAPTEAEIQALRDSIHEQTGYTLLPATASMALQDVHRVRDKTSTNNNPHGVKVGQVWEDNDRRAKGRRGPVIKVTDTHAFVSWYTSITTRVKLTRFRPTSTGYRLIQDVEA